MSEPRSLPPVRSVVFTADLLRLRLDAGPPEWMPARTLGWLRELLHPLLPSTVERCDSIVAPSDRDALLRALGDQGAIDAYLAQPELAWAERFRADRLDIFAREFERMADADLVVGFELPPAIKTFLHRRDKAYVSWHVHPLRFLPDLCLGATTNRPGIAACLRQAAVPEQVIRDQVARFRAKFRFRQPGQFRFPQGAPVLVGQTARDSVLIRDGRFADWSDFDESLARLLAGHDTVVFVEHPYRADSSDVAEHVRQVHGRTVISTRANGYGVLLGGTHIPSVITLSSSLAVEAEAFGLPPHFLLDDPRQRLTVPGVDTGVLPPLGHAALSTAMWSVLCGATRPARRSLRPIHDPFQLGPDFLRNALDGWSYRFLVSDLTGPNVRKQVWPASSRTDTARLRESLTSTAGDVDVVTFDPPLAAGEVRTVQLGDASAASWFRSGFHPSEPWGVWSSNQDSELRLSVDRATVEAGCRLRIEFTVGVFEGVRARTALLRIACGHDLLGCVVFRPGAPATQVVALQTARLGPSPTLRFEMSHLDSPASTGSADARLLGFSLTSMTVECLPLDADAEPECRRLPAWGIAAGPVLLGPSTPSAGTAAS